MPSFEKPMQGVYRPAYIGDNIEKAVMIKNLSRYISDEI